jgi:endo-1,4-beta-xylanase
MRSLLLFILCLFPALSGYLPAEAKSKKMLGNILSSATPDPDFAKYWNQVTPEDQGKFGYIEKNWGYLYWDTLDAIHQYAREHGYSFKEHNFVWGLQQPYWMRLLTPESQRANVEYFIREYGKRYPDTDFIDVVNEPIHNPPFYKNALGGDGKTGWDWVIWSYATARKYNPHAKLILNEYFMNTGWGDLETFIYIVQLLQVRGLIDGIGIQAHDLEGVSDARIRTFLDYLARLKLPIYISELDVNIANDKNQLARYRTLFPIFWTHPAVKGVTLWGYKEGHIWQEHAYLLRKDGTERPALVWLQDYTNEVPHEK